MTLSATTGFRHPHGRRRMRRLGRQSIAMVLLCGATLYCAAARGEARMKSFLGERPPELVFEPEWWINSEPLTLEKLRGKVVWLQYHF